MLRLVQNVLSNRILPGPAHAEGAVARLPREGPELRPFFMCPARRVGLGQPGDVRHGVSRGHSNQEMDMIGHTVDTERGTAKFAEDATEIGVQIGLNLLRNQRRPVTGAEDKMDQDIRRRMAHALTPLRG